MEEMVCVMDGKNGGGDESGWVEMREEWIMKGKGEVMVRIDGWSLGDLKKREGWNGMKGVKEKEVFELNRDVA